MSEEYVYDRERDFLDYLRNNLEDPENRGVDIIEESHIASSGQTDFVLNHTLVKNVATEITLNGVRKRKGYDFTVDYGIGNNDTKVILKVAADLNDELLISYHYGESMVEKEFSRNDVTLPRVVVIFLNGSEDFAGLGDIMNDGLGSYYNVSYRLEIRDKYANRARVITSKAFNLIRKLRHKSLFRTNIASADGMTNFDYDIDKAAYIWQFNANIQWEIQFE